MKHRLMISTVEALVLNKALRLADLQNDTDELMARQLIDRINGVVEKDIKRQKPTDLTNKCGSCKWSAPRRGAYVNCTCPRKNPNFFARSNPKCKFYEVKESDGE